MPLKPDIRHTWKFFRTGGLDQVSLETGADLLALGQLDQKLWVALSCPVKGLEIDEKTLALIDSDGDGRVGVPDVIAAVNWAAERLNDAGSLLSGDNSLPLSAINVSTPEGKVLQASARQILASIGRTDAGGISVSEASDTVKVMAGNPLNGDGIILPEATDNPEAQAIIKDIVACIGSATRSSGSTGVTSKMIDTFFAELAAYVEWTEQSGATAVAVLGAGTDAACSAIRAVRVKVDDYFARTRLAAFDECSVPALNRSEADYVAVAGKDIGASVEEVRGFPLARVAAGLPLPLVEGINPAWATEISSLRKNAVVPVFGTGTTSLTADEWGALNAKIAPFETWLAGKAGSDVEKVGLSRAKEILTGGGRAQLAALVERDKTLEPEFKAIGDVERLSRFYRDLRTLLCNFVNFADFYSPNRYAAFQAGTLYLDSRSTELCICVDNASPLAAMSRAFIAYCSCTRADGAKMTIAACFTQGGSEYLFIGRNGIFYDRRGTLWYATIAGVADNPISIREAFWSPYKKFLRMIDEKLAKRAAAADATSINNLNTAADKAANVEKPTPPPRKFDLALITGIGVAIGSIGTFVATLFAKFVDIPAWQIPLVFVGLVLVISLPSMFIAALKLRQRTLGPILEGAGWAVNARVKINIPFGAALTRLATLPPGAQRSLKDPYADKAAEQRRSTFLVIAILLVALGLSIWIRVDRDRRGYYFWEDPPTLGTSSPSDSS
jgi:hypothetical protein